MYEKARKTKEAGAVSDASGTNWGYKDRQEPLDSLADFVDQSKEFALCLKWNGKPVECWQKEDLIWFMFKCYHSGCSVGKALKGEKVEEYLKGLW